MNLSDVIADGDFSPVVLAALQAYELHRDALAVLVADILQEKLGTNVDRFVAARAFFSGGGSGEAAQLLGIEDGSRREELKNLLRKLPDTERLPEMGDVWGQEVLAAMYLLLEEMIKNKQQVGTTEV